MTRRIFRPAALGYYNDRLEKIVLPRYASPPWPAVFYSFVGLLLALTALLWSTKTPVYAIGSGVVVTMPTGFRGAAEAVMVAFLPPQYGSHVQVGQPAILFMAGGSATGMNHRVAAVRPGLASPAAVRTRYGLDASTGLLVEGPSVVTLIRLDAPAETVEGSFGEVRIEVGEQRGLALLPGIGHFFSVGGHAPE